MGRSMSKFRPHIMMKEIWKDIKGWEGCYQVSNHGRIKTLKRAIFRLKGEGELLYYLKEKIIVTFGRPGLYVQVHLNRYGKQFHFFVHRLVAEAFIPNPKNKAEVNHINGLKTDNVVTNLQWVSRSENIRHSFDFLGRKTNPRKGADHFASKPVLQFDLTGSLLKEWVNISEARKSFLPKNVSVGNCCNGKQKQSMGFIWRYK